jgi:hypothetical protein
VLLGEGQSELDGAPADQVVGARRTSDVGPSAHLSLGDDLRLPNLGHPSGRHRESAAASNDTLVGYVRLKEFDDVNRRQFAFSTAIATMGVPAFLREALTADRAGAGVPVATVDDVDQLAFAIDSLERSYALSGGGDLWPVAVHLYDRVTTWRSIDGHAAKVDTALSRLQGDVGTWVGWLAYDAGDQALAGRYLNQAIVHARLADDPAAEVRAMSDLCVLLNKQGRHREALHCAQAGQRAAANWAPPRIVALLHLREASSWARLGNDRSFGASVTAAYRQFDRGLAPTDPVWSHFVNESELQGLTADGLVALGRHDLAKATYLPVVEKPDPRYRRAWADYSARLAHSILQQGDITEASERALAVLPVATTLQSDRVTELLHRIRTSVVPHCSTVTKADEFVQAFDRATAP